MIILDGKIARDSYKQKLILRAKVFSQPPLLAIIQIGDNKESSIYIEQKKAFAQAIGARVEHIHFAAKEPLQNVEDKIRELNARADVQGILVQLPLPEDFDKQALVNLIDPKKDVDGLTDTSGFVPATAKGVMLLLDFYGVAVAGRRVAVLGRSRLVGHPIAELLKTRGALVSVCHSKTPNTREITQKSDIIIVAIGKPLHIDASYIQEGAIVIDVGINSVTGDSFEEELPKRKLVGDVDYQSVAPHVSAITPVPGGVGPMTVLALFDSLICSAENYNQ